MKSHGTKVSGYCPVCRGACELGPRTPDPPRRIPAEELAAAKEAVRGAVSRFLLRLYRAGLLEEEAVRRACDRLGILVDAEDFDRGS